MVQIIASFLPFTLLDRSLSNKVKGRVLSNIMLDFKRDTPSTIIIEKIT